MLTPDQYNRILESVCNLLTSAIETLVEKAGKNRKTDVAQLLTNISATFDYINAESALKNVTDEELCSAIQHIYYCLKADKTDLVARQIARPYIGQQEETDAVRKIVTNSTIIFLSKQITKLSNCTNNTDILMHSYFQVLLENTSTEDANQKKERIGRPNSLFSSSSSDVREQYKIFLIGSQADTVSHLLRINFLNVRQIKLNFVLYKDVNVFLMTRGRQHFDLLLICCPNIREASLFANQLSGVRDKICLVSLSKNRNHYVNITDYPVITPPFSDAFISFIRGNSSNNTVTRSLTV